MRAAVIQLNSQNDPGANVEAAGLLLASAARQGATYALLPENFAFFGSEQEKLSKGNEISDRALGFLRQAAAQYSLTITGGGMPMPAANGKFYNAALTVTPQGEILHRYDKLHLFDAMPGDNVSYQESRSTQAGGPHLATFETNGLAIGMSICYDLRFPALYRAYARKGAQALCVPAAFTRVTGAAHWHVLLRSRAIENTCYVLAAAQCGEHFGGRQTYGHSMIIDPWGEIVAELDERPGVAVADLSLQRIEEVRQRLPSLRHDKIV
ncbi:MAG: carbon-nitrogen hydrolase family protein [Turneriella sp.]